MNDLLFVLRVVGVIGLALAVFLVVRRRLGGLSFGVPGRKARPRLCPHLGLATDPFKHYPGANEDHRCYANMGRERIDLAHQRRFCLASCYSRCPFLTVKETGLFERIWAWGRAVSPIPQAQAGIPRRPLGSPWGSPSVVAARRLARVYGPMLAALAAELSPGLVRLTLWVVRRTRPVLQTIARRLAAARVQWHARRTAVAAPVVPVAPVAPVAPVVPVVAPPLVEAPEVVPACAPEPAEAAPEPVMIVSTVGDVDLAEQGIRALEAGDETAAYALFRRATERQPRDLRAWFWRAKTADSLDEVITCLEKALALEPANTQVKANLDSAMHRREQARAQKAASKSKPVPTSPLAARHGSRGLRAFVQLGYSLRELTRTLTAVAAFGVGAAWLLSALPPELRQAVSAAGGLASLPVPDAATVFAQLPLSLPVLDGYATTSALPYGLGFLGEFIGLGLLSGDRWTRGWAPLLGMGSAWLWLHTSDASISPWMLAACILMASGGALADARRPRPLAGQQEPRFA
jgi:hypothetical protein